MKPYLLAAILFAAAAYLWLTSPPVEPLNLTTPREVTLEEYQRGSNGGFVPNNPKRLPPTSDPCADLGGQRLSEEQAAFRGSTCVRGSEYNCRVAAEHLRCMARQNAREWGMK